MGQIFWPGYVSCIERESPQFSSTHENYRACVFFTISCVRDGEGWGQFCFERVVRGDVVSSIRLSYCVSIVMSTSWNNGTLNRISA